MSSTDVNNINTSKAITLLRIIIFQIKSKVKTFSFRGEKADL